MLKSPIFLVGDFFCLSLYGNQITNIMTTTVNQELRAEFLSLRNDFKSGKITKQQYMSAYYSLGEKNGLTLYNPTI